MTTTHPSAARPDVRRALLRGVAPVVIGILLGGVIALGVTALLHKHYTATSRVLVTATGADAAAQANSRTTSAINLDTEAQLVKSASVVDGAVKNYSALGKRPFDQVVQDITVTVPPNSSVLEIAYTADSPGVARSAANALAAAYLDDRGTSAQQLLDRQKKQSQQTVAGLNDQLDKVSNQLAALPGTAKGRPLLQSRIGILKNQINGENQQIVTLGSVQITPGRVVTAASLPDKPSSPSRTINGVSGAALGLVVGLLAAWLLLRHVRSVRRAGDVSHVVDVACIGVVSPRNSSTAVEQYRRLALLVESSVHDARRVTFVAPLDSATTGQIATGVAVALVRGGHPTALLRVNIKDVNGQRPRGLPVESRPSTDAIAPGERLDAGLDHIRGDREMLVVAVGGATTTADAAALGAMSDAVVLVVDAGTRSKYLRDTVRVLDEVGAPVLGVVLARGGGTAATATPRTFDEAIEREREAAEDDDVPAAGKRAAHRKPEDSAEEPAGEPAEESPAQPQPEAVQEPTATDEAAADPVVTDDTEPEPLTEASASTEDQLPFDATRDEGDSDDVPDDGPAGHAGEDTPQDVPATASTDRRRRSRTRTKSGRTANGQARRQPQQPTSDADARTDTDTADRQPTRSRFSLAGTPADPPPQQPKRHSG